MTGLEAATSGVTIVNGPESLRSYWEPKQDMHRNLADASRHAPAADKPASALPD
jgi:hypothetical protein